MEHIQTSQTDDLDWVAEKLGENKKTFKKSITKAQAQADQVDGSLYQGKTAPGTSLRLAIFETPLDELAVVSVPIRIGIIDLSVMIPPFLRDVGQRILDVSSTVGLFRIAPNYKRLSHAMEEIDSGRSVVELPDLRPSELAHLLKDWLRDLPQRLIPDSLTPYFFRLFDASSSSVKTEDRTKIMQFFSKLIPFRAREVMIFVCHILSRVAANHKANQMDARNLALVCPTLLTGTADLIPASCRKFEDGINLMEYLINNPDTFITKTSIMHQPPTFGALPKDFKFSAPFMTHSPRRGRFEFDIRTPVHSIRLIAKKMKTDLKSRNSPKMTRKRASLDRTDYQLNTAPVLPAVAVQCPAISPLTVQTPTPSKKHYRDRPRSIVHIGSASSPSPKCFGDIEMMSLTPEKIQPIRLDFEERSPAETTEEVVTCERCQKLLADMENMRPKTEVQDASVQVDFLDTGSLPTTPRKSFAFAVPISPVTIKSPSPRRACLSDAYGRTSNFARQLSSASVIPSGLVAHRLQSLALGNLGKSSDLSLYEDPLD